MKSIVMIGTQFVGVPALNGGAIELLSFDLAKVLADNGFKVSYFSMQGEQEFKKHNLAIERFPAKKTSGILFNAFVFLKLLGKKTDAIYLTGCSLLPAALLLKKIKKVPLIFHEFNHNPWIAEQNVLFDFLAKKSVQSADKIIVPTNFIRQKICEFDNKLQSKIQVLENFVDLNEFPLEKPKKFRQIVFVGRLVKHKNPDLLVKAFSNISESFPEWKLKIFGPINDKSFYGSLLGNGNGNVSFHSNIERKKLIQELSNASVFVLPSTQEAFGLAFLEAMACWTPCIGVRINSVKELIEENQTGFLVNAFSLTDLQNKLFILLSQEQMRDSMGEMARKKAENLSLSMVSPKYLKFFQEAVK